MRWYEVLALAALVAVVMIIVLSVFGGESRAQAPADPRVERPLVPEVAPVPVPRPSPFPPGAPQATGRCMPREAALAQLGRAYGEELVGIGIGQRGASVVELYANRETGTWTALVTRPDGVSCAAAAGTDWQDVPPGEPL